MLNWFVPVDPPVEITLPLAAQYKPFTNILSAYTLPVTPTPPETFNEPVVFDVEEIPLLITTLPAAVTPPTVIESYIKLASAKLTVVVGSDDMLLKNIQLPSK